MAEKIGWFALFYVCLSCSITVLMLIIAGRALKVGGPLAMVRCISLLVLAIVGFIIWAAKAATGTSQGSADEEIRRTIRKTSHWVNNLKEEWDKGKEH